MLLFPARHHCALAVGPVQPTLVAEAWDGNSEECYRPEAGQRSIIMAAALQGHSDGLWHPGAIPCVGGIATAPPLNNHRSEWSPPSMTELERSG